MCSVRVRLVIVVHLDDDWGCLSGRGWGSGGSMGTVAFSLEATTLTKPARDETDASEAWDDAKNEVKSYVFIWASLAVSVTTFIQLIALVLCLGLLKFVVYALVAASTLIGVAGVKPGVIGLLLATRNRGSAIVPV